MRISSRALTLVTLAVVVVLFAVIFIYRNQTRNAAPTATGPIDFQVDRQPVLGDPDAPVTIVSFEDFKCPVCQRFERDVVPQVESQLIETGQAKMVFVNFQFLGPDSTTAGIAGECAYRQDNDLFWEYKQAIFRAQGPETQQWATPSRLVQIASEAVPDLDAEELATCIQEQRYADEVELDESIARNSGVTGTPTVFVNGERLASWDFNSIQAAVQRASESAE